MAITAYIRRGVVSGDDICFIFSFFGSGST